jgi:type IV secretory pathway VirB10-like protein
MLRVTPNGNLVNDTDKKSKSQEELPEKPDKAKVRAIDQKGGRVKPLKPKPDPKPKPEKPAAPPPVPDIPLPDKLAKTPTVQSVASGAYAKKLLAHYGNILLPASLNSLHRKILTDDMSANKLTAEIYRMLPAKGGPLVQVNQSNDNRSATINNGSPRSSFATADEMFRQIAADRERRALGPAPMEFTVIPEDTKVKAD